MILRYLLHPKVLIVSLAASLSFFSVSDGADKEIRVPISKSSSGAPDGWKLKEWKGKSEFNVVDAEFGNAIYLKSNSSSSALYRDINFRLKDYPVIRWSWKVTSLPKGADVRKKSTDDQAAQVYVIFPKFPASINSRLVGYIWDTTAPAGTMLTSTKSSNTKYIVLRSGNDGTGKWLTEQRNVYEDYRKLFKEEPPAVGSISVMIDSDDTKSSAESFIGNIHFSRDINQSK